MVVVPNITRVQMTATGGFRPDVTRDEVFSGYAWIAQVCVRAVCLRKGGVHRTEFFVVDDEARKTAEGQEIQVKRCRTSIERSREAGAEVVLTRYTLVSKRPFSVGIYEDVGTDAIFLKRLFGNRVCA